MAATPIIEQEKGAYVGSPHPHNGSYAGDFSRFPLPSGPVRPVLLADHPVQPH